MDRLDLCTDVIEQIIMYTINYVDLKNESILDSLNYETNNHFTATPVAFRATLMFVSKSWYKSYQKVISQYLYTYKIVVQLTDFKLSRKQYLKCVWHNFNHKQIILYLVTNKIINAERCKYIGILDISTSLEKKHTISTIFHEKMYTDVPDLAQEFASILSVSSIVDYVILRECDYQPSVCPCQYSVSRLDDCEYSFQNDLHTKALSYPDI